jgi:hypothetical protein
MSAAPIQASPPALGWLDSFNRAAARAGLGPAKRLELFLSLPTGEQADHFAQLGQYEHQERFLDGNLDWPTPPVPARRDATPTRRGHSKSTRDHDDVLDTISLRDYWPALTGEPVSRSGRVRCPASGHEDLHPSCVVYREPGRGWWCPVCQAGGSVIDLAAIVTGIEARGQGYWRLREWIAERLLNAPIGGAEACR